MNHKPFFLAFLKYYLPEQVFQSIDWNSAELFKISGEHIREVFPLDPKAFNLKKDIGNLAYLAKKNNKHEKVLVYTH